MSEDLELVASDERDHEDPIEWGNLHPEGVSSK